MKPFVIFLMLTAVGWPSVCAPAVLRLEESVDAMGTTFSVVTYGPDRFKMQAAVELAFDEARRLDQLLSNYRPASEWSEVNRYAAERPVKVSRELYDLLAACIRYSEVSEGAFDITVGPLMRVWGFYKGSGRFPHRAEIKGALARVGYKYIELNASNQTVNFRKRGVEMDPGGIGKGYAVDRMVETLKQNGITSALITAGSSSIYGLGIPDGEPKGWHVSVTSTSN